MNDESAQHSDHFLHRHVRMIKEGPVLVQLKLINKAFTGLHGFLSNARNPIHLDWDFKPMPMYARRFREMVIEDDPDAVAVICLNGRAGRASVETPQIECASGYDRLFHRLRNQLEDLDAVVDGERKIRNIWRQNRRRGPGIRLIGGTHLLGSRGLRKQYGPSSSTQNASEEAPSGVHADIADGKVSFDNSDLFT